MHEQAFADVPIDGHALPQLKEINDSNGMYQDNDLVFASIAGTPIQHRNLDRRHFKKIIELANARISKANEGTPLQP